MFTQAVGDCASGYELAADEIQKKSSIGALILNGL